MAQELVPVTLGLARCLADSGDWAGAERALADALAAGAATSHPYQVLATFAGFEAARGRGFRAYRLAGAAAQQRELQPDTDLALQQWLSNRLLQAGQHMSDDSSSTEWLWGNRLSFAAALTYAVNGVAQNLPTTNVTE